MLGLFIHLFTASEFDTQVKDDGNVEQNMEGVEIVRHSNYQGNAHDFEQHYSLGKHGDPEYWTNYFEQSQLDKFKDEAYKRKEGYSVRTNPFTGNKELFIAGTRSGGEWLQNIVEGAEHAGLPSAAGWLSERSKRRYADRLEEIIEKEGVTVVYGHSRGAAIMSLIGSPGVTKVGIDGASFIGDKENYLNIIQSRSITGLGDNLIAAGHHNNIRIKQRAFHDVTRARKHKSVKKVSGTSERKKARAKASKEARAEKVTKAREKGEISKPGKRKYEAGPGTAQKRSYGGKFETNKRKKADISKVGRGAYGLRKKHKEPLEEGRRKKRTASWWWRNFER